ncbi:hypothetical protein SAMN05444401_2893 [Clostridium amylolyticum]|uniref:Thiamine-phosphate pyrophosphorylase n=1 Tax=Clostridium amylolyticum TaxID=1121298 RepID=A0A1M6IMT2_9CLOT|nr:hypothetical protein [Clostridium amylolyticum]SHJ35725.1 hypothetical protein SAMN05444401_2893 [Clostridium amylolyticum]
MLFKNLLENNKMTLVVSLPENSFEMAKAAYEAGAQALKMHINVHHRASGNDFGNFQSGKELFRSISREFNVPLGVVPGGQDAFATKEEMQQLEDMGVDFYSAYYHHLPANIADTKKLTRMVAIDNNYNEVILRGIENSPMEVLEASIMPGESYGQPLYFRDLMQYSAIASTISKPVLVPTQKKIKPEEIKLLHEVGVKAIMIGAVVTTKDIENLKKVTSEFREAIERL